MEILTTFLYIVFVLMAIVLIVVVLLQEGQGGGFGQFLGEGGQQTFGVGSKGINTFTGYVAAAFIVCALALNYLNRDSGSGSVTDNRLDSDFGLTNEPAVAPFDPTSGQPGAGGGRPSPGNFPGGAQPGGGSGGR